MSSPSADNDYQVSTGFILNRVIWNAVFLSISQRITAVEALNASFQELIDEGTEAAIANIQNNLGPTLEAVATQIEGLQALIAQAEDAVSQIVSQGLPSTSVSFDPAAGIGATTAQAAFVELAGDIAALSASTAAQLATRPSLGLTIALGG